MIRVTARALRSLRDIADYFVEYAGEETASRFTDAARHSFELIQCRPRIGSPSRFKSPRLDDLRAWPVLDFSNYMIFYREVRGGIEIIDIIHAARDLPRVLGN